MLRLVIREQELLVMVDAPWALMTHAGIPFEEIQVWAREPIRQRRSRAIRRRAPCGAARRRSHGLGLARDLRVSRGEFAASKLWLRPLLHAPKPVRRPRNACRLQRVAHQHADEHPQSLPGTRHDPEVAGEVARIERLFNGCLQRWGGPYLYGEYSIADAMYVPCCSVRNLCGEPDGRRRGLPTAHARDAGAGPARALARRRPSLARYDTRYAQEN